MAERESLYNGFNSYSGEPLLWNKFLKISIIFLFILVLGGIFGISFTIHPLVALIFLLGIALAGVIWYEPAWGLLLVLFVIPLQFLGKINEDGSLTLARIVTPLVIFIWSLKHLINKDSRLLKSFFNHPILIAGFIYILSTLPSFFNTRNISFSIGFLGLKLLPLWLLAVLIVELIRDRIWLFRGYKVILAISFIVASFGIYELFTRESILHLFGMEYYLISGAKGGELASTKWESFGEADVEWVRVASTFLDPDFFGSYLILALGFAFGLLFTIKSAFWKGICISFIPIALVDIVATGSRSLFLAIFVFFSILLVLVQFRGKWVLLCLLVFMAVAIIPFIQEIVPSFREGVALSFEEFKKDPRYGFWSTALNMIFDHPILGVGLGNFIEVYYNYKADSSILTKAYLPHNIVLLVFSETGVMGLIFFTIFVSVVGVTLLKNYCDKSNSDIWLLNLFIFASFLAYSLFALTSNTLDQEYIWVVCGIIAVLSNLNRLKEKR